MLTGSPAKEEVRGNEAQGGGLIAREDGSLPSRSVPSRSPPPPSPSFLCHGLWSSPHAESPFPPSQASSYRQTKSSY
eukprot:1080969-Rhodomonas_salina.2